MDRTDAIVEILIYGISFRCSALSMIKEKYPDLDLFDVVLIEIKGYDKLDSPMDSIDKGTKVLKRVLWLLLTRQGWKRTKKKKYCGCPSQSPIFEFDITSDHMEDPLNVPSNPDN